MWMSPEVFERRAAEMREKYAAISLREVQARRVAIAEAKGEVKWKDPKRKRSLWSLKRYGKVQDPGPPTAKKTDAEKRRLFADTSTDDLRRREMEMLSEIDNMERLIPLLKSGVRNVRAELRIREGLAEAPRWRTNDGSIEYPDRCPRCGHDKIIRAGFVGTSRNQMFRCKSCNSTFVNPNTKEKKPLTEYHLVCHRCGGTNTENRGPGHKDTQGRQAFCFTCDKGFTQGGKFHLEQNYAELEGRVKALGVPSGVSMEILQDAALRVLQGEGYVGTIDLHKSAAFREVYGEFNQRGSDHPQFRLQNDQPMFDD